MPPARRRPRRAAPARTSREQVRPSVAAGQRRTEESLRLSEERLAADLAAMRRLQHLSTRLVNTADADELLLEIVDAAIAITGADMGNVQLRERDGGALRIVASRGFAAPFLEFFGAVQAGEAVCGAALEHGERVVVEDVEASPLLAGTPALEVMRAAGVRALQSTPLVSRSGRIVGMLSTHYRRVRAVQEADLRILDLLARQAADWIERTQTEQALRESEAQLRGVLDTAADAIITIDGRGAIRSVNPATERMFGYTAAEMIGRNVGMLMPAPYHEEHDGHLARYLRTGEKRIIGLGREVRAQRKDGTSFSIDLAVSEVEPGKVFTGIIRDVAERKAAEMRLRAADRMASIGTLAAGLGHDMNNVLLPVRARLNALRAAGEAGQLPAAQRAHVEEIRKSVAYLQQLADGLHFLALDPESDQGPRGGAGATDLRQWWAQVGALLSKAVPRHVRVSASIPTDLAPAAITPHGLTQAVLNLVVNAGDAIPGPEQRKRRQGHVRVWARTAKGTHGESVHLGVTDNGSGMSEEVKRRAFEMFYTTKPRGLGTGLGLALVRKVVEHAGGRVEIESEVGKGTTVLIIVPVGHAPAHPGAGAEACSAAISVADGRAAALIRQLLESAGARVRVDGDPAGAEIWVVDPATTSLELARAWRTQTPRGRLVLLGAPRARPAAWQALEPVTIEHPDDLVAVTAALGRVVAVG